MEENEVFAPEERDYRAEILAIIRGDYESDKLKELLEEYHDNDVASVLEEDLTPEERDRLLDAIGTEEMSDIVPFLEDAGEYISELEAELIFPEENNRKLPLPEHIIKIIL